MTIVYNIRQKCVKIYRCSISIKTKNDWFSNNEYTTYESVCKYDFSHVKRGLFSHDITDEQLKFFTNDISKCKPCFACYYPNSNLTNIDEIVLFDGDLNMCFTDFGSLVLFKKDLGYISQRKTFTFKTLSKSVRAFRDKWKIAEYRLHNKYSHFYKENSYSINAWDFKKDSDFVVFDLNLWEIHNFIPEVFNYNKELLLDYKELSNYLYSLEPFGSDNDYDVSPEEREKINAEKERRRLEAEAYRKQIEKQKEMDGYCDRCGAPNANYVANPYYREIYGSIHMEWLCDDCYSDCCGDI